MKLPTDSIASLPAGPLFTKVVLLTLFLACGFVLVNRLKPVPKTEVKPLPQDAAVKVYFNQNPASKNKDPYRHFIVGDNLSSRLMLSIRHSQV